MHPAVAWMANRCRREDAPHYASRQFWMSGMHTLVRPAVRLLNSRELPTFGFDPPLALPGTEKTLDSAPFETNAGVEMAASDLCSF